MSTQTQPAPVLAWHRAAAKELVISCIVQPRNELFVAPTIARHDPHQETARLLEEAADAMFDKAESSRLLTLASHIRAHLAALQQEGAAK